MDASLQKLQTRFNPINSTSVSRFLITPGVEDQNSRSFVGPIDREASAKTAYSISAFQVAPQREPSIASSVGESENHSSPATFQVASTPGFPSQRRSKPSAPHARTFLWEPVPAPHPKANPIDKHTSTQTSSFSPSCQQAQQAPQLCSSCRKFCKAFIPETFLELLESPFENTQHPSTIYIQVATLGCEIPAHTT